MKSNTNKTKTSKKKSSIRNRSAGEQRKEKSATSQKKYMNGGSTIMA